MMPTSSEVLARWPAWYPDAPPVGFLLRESYPDRWLRIYSLPEGKRYPTSGFDYVELLRRHHAVAADVIGLEMPCAVLLLDTCRGGGTRAAGITTGLADSGLPWLAQLPLSLSDEQCGVFAAPMCIFGHAVVFVVGPPNGRTAFEDDAACQVTERALQLTMALLNGGFAPQIMRRRCT